MSSPRWNQLALHAQATLIYSGTFAGYPFPQTYQAPSDGSTDGIGGPMMVEGTGFWLQFASAWNGYDMGHT